MAPRVIRVIELPTATRGHEWAVVTPAGVGHLVISQHPSRRAANAAAALERAKNPAAVALGRMGGTSTSKAKATAARANGALGGRPRKAAR